MSEVKRYVTTCDCMSEASWGDYVQHEDYAALEAECARLRKTIAAAQRVTVAVIDDRDAARAELAASDQALRESRANEAAATRMLAEAREELAALEGEQVAVAWRVTGAGGLTVTPQYPSWAEDDSRLLITPLYARPLPQPSASALLLASRRVYDGLNKRIEDASMDGDLVPVFDGIADLHEALAAYEDKP